MTINELMEQKHISKYRLSKESGIPYSTVQDICSGKAALCKCSAETVYRLAKALKVTMESLLEPYAEQRVDFELFKSNVCHSLKEQGDTAFVINVLESDDITKYYNSRRYPECLYLLAMLDYVSRENNIPLCKKYNKLRGARLSETVYPLSVLSVAAADIVEVKKRAEKNAIPEFIRFNIVENEVRNVI